MQEPTNHIPWSTDFGDYYNIDLNSSYDVNFKKIADHLREKVKANGDCIYVASFRLKPINDDIEVIAVSKVQLDDSIVHMNLCLGDNVAFLTAGDYSVGLYQLPSRYRRWEMCRLPFNDVDLGVRIVIDTVIQCKQCDVNYNSHMLKNIEHMLCRLVMSSHGECDCNLQGDYDFDKPDTWKHGVNCSQLVLLVLKRCVMHGAIGIDDKDLKNEFLSIYSYTCMPGALYRLIDRIWSPRHTDVQFTWDDCMANFDKTRTPCLEKSGGEAVQKNPLDTDK
jgi:hypothetical protein